MAGWKSGNTPHLLSSSLRADQHQPASSPEGGSSFCWTSGKLCGNRRDRGKMKHFLSEEQYNELDQFWREFMMLGPTLRQKGLNLIGLALDFIEWIDSVEDEPYYGLPEIHAFFAEKKRRDGTSVNEW